MKAAKCRLCGKEHWNYEGCDPRDFVYTPTALAMVGAKSEADLDVPSADRRGVLGPAVCAGCVELRGELAVARARIAELESNKVSNVSNKSSTIEANGSNKGFDKKEYQRKLMRDRRAKAKAAKGAS